MGTPPLILRHPVPVRFFCIFPVNFAILSLINIEGGSYDYQ